MLQRHFHVSLVYPQQPTFFCVALTDVKGQTRDSCTAANSGRINRIISTHIHGTCRVEEPSTA